MTPEEVRILAWTLLGEAAGEGDLGMKAVAHVIRNRAESGRFPSNPAMVAIQNNGRYYQFSAWNRPADQGNSPRARYPVGTREFNNAARIVAQVFGPTPGNDPTQGATHYYSPGGMKNGAAPYWWASEAPKGGKKIGGHIFAIRHDGPVTPVMPTPRPAPGTPATAIETDAYGFPVDGSVTRYTTNDSPEYKRRMGIGTPSAPQTRLPPLSDPATGGTFVYDPVRGTTVLKPPPARELVTLYGTAKAAMSYAGQERGSPTKLDGRTSVAGFSVPGGVEGIRTLETPGKSVTRQELEAQGPSYAGQDRGPATTSGGALGGTKDQTRLETPTTPGPLRIESGGLSRDAVAQRAKAAAELGAFRVGQVREIPPLPRPRPQTVAPTQPSLKVIVQGGNYSSEDRAQSGSGVNLVRTQTGKVVPAGQEYQGSDGYNYRVESNGTITNLKSGSNSGTWYNPESNQFEWR